MYLVRITKSAQKALEQVSQPHQDRIIEAIRSLGEEPRPFGCKKLSGRDAWRIRVGDYRVLYEIYDGELIVLIILVGHRRHAYKIRH